MPDEKPYHHITTSTFSRSAALCMSLLICCPYYQNQNPYIYIQKQLSRNQDGLNWRFNDLHNEIWIGCVLDSDDSGDQHIRSIPVDLYGSASSSSRDWAVRMNRKRYSKVTGVFGVRFNLDNASHVDRRGYRREASQVRDLKHYTTGIVLVSARDAAIRFRKYL